MTDPIERTPGVGEAIRQRREYLHLSQEELAQRIHLPPHMLDAIEREDWGAIPPGRERPLVRQLMARLEMDLDTYEESWGKLPGALEQEAPDPRKDLLERILMASISLGAVALLLWLVLPGPNIKLGIPGAKPTRANLPWAPQGPAPAPGFPVLGELLPEAGVTPDGVLVSLRAQDTCEAHLVGPQTDQTRTLRVSEPWKLRIKGPFSLTLGNAGMVDVEVAGKRIRHPVGVGETWSGQFGADGQTIQPPSQPSEAPPTAPETDLESSPEPEGTE